MTSLGKKLLLNKKGIGIDLNSWNNYLYCGA